MEDLFQSQREEFRGSIISGQSPGNEPRDIFYRHAWAPTSARGRCRSAPSTERRERQWGLCWLTTAACSGQTCTQWCKSYCEGDNNSRAPTGYYIIHSSTGATTRTNLKRDERYKTPSGIDKVQTCVIWSNCLLYKSRISPRADQSSKGIYGWRRARALHLTETRNTTLRAFSAHIPLRESSEVDLR